MLGKSNIALIKLQCCINKLSHIASMKSVLGAISTQVFSVNNVSIWRNKFKLFCSGLKSLSSFLMHVSHVVYMSAKEQMIRSNALRVIAFVTDEKTFGYLTKSYFIRKAMSVFLNTFFTFHPNNNTSIPITTTACSTNPIPTSISFRYFGPKSLFNSYKFSFDHVIGITHNMMVYQGGCNAYFN